MTFELFCNAVAEEVRLKLPDNCRLEHTTVLKNNNLLLHGLILRKESSGISPNVYLNSLYEDYKEGRPISEIASHIYQILSVHASDFPCGLSDIVPFSPSHEANIYYRIINRKKNKNLLKEIPHLPFLDLAVTFHYLVFHSEKNIGSVRITNELMNRWHLTTEQLYAYAKKNTPRLFPYNLRTMEQVLTELISNDLDHFMYCKNITDDSDSGQIGDLLDALTDIPSGKPDMYILSNRSGINGASAILYDGLLSEFSKSMNCGYYILPSSIHEVILIPDQHPARKEDLQEMVREVNSSHVPPEDVLSDSVYHFDPALETIELL